MSHGLARKFDKIVSKLSHKHKADDNASHSSTDSTGHESIFQRVKGHLAHPLMKTDSHSSRLDGIPPYQCIVEELKHSPFQGKRRLLRSHGSIRVREGK